MMTKRALAAGLVLALLLGAGALAEDMPVSVTAPGENVPVAVTAPGGSAPVAVTVPGGNAPVAFTPLPAATPAPLSGRTVTIRRSGDVNVRRQPRYDSDKVGVARAGRTYALIDVAESGWYRIRLMDGVEGYISPKLVQGQPESATAQRVIIRKSGNANVRSEADAASRRVGVARAGRSYPLLSTEENGWYRILLSGGIVGYVSPKVVLRVTEAGENPDATPAPVSDVKGTVTIRRQGNVNVRQQPEYSSPKIGTATAGRKYPLLDTAENGWYRIRLENGVEGYISSKLAQ